VTNSKNKMSGEGRATGVVTRRDDVNNNSNSNAHAHTHVTDEVVFICNA
jgi:hypothetical protein